MEWVLLGIVIYFLVIMAFVSFGRFLKDCDREIYGMGEEEKKHDRVKDQQLQNYRAKMMRRMGE
jgi:hypothetical protein